MYWAEVVQAREPRPDEHVYTVAAQTDTAGLLYLTVAVATHGRPKARDGGLSGVRRGSGHVGAGRPRLAWRKSPILRSPRWSNVPCATTSRARLRSWRRTSRATHACPSRASASCSNRCSGCSGRKIDARWWRRCRRRCPWRSLRARLRTRRRRRHGSLGGLGDPDGPDRMRRATRRPIARAAATPAGCTRPPRLKVTANGLRARLVCASIVLALLASCSLAAQGSRMPSRRSRRLQTGERSASPGKER